MRLLEIGPDGKLALTRDFTEKIPSYAILSHTWGPEDEEVTFQDLVNGTGENKTGHTKIWNFGKLSRRDELNYFWVDTCCIDKTNNTELTEAIASMFSWYRDATKCYVFLPDVSIGNSSSDHTKQSWIPAFQSSRWFKRGWTLQELLAPKSIEFFSCEWEILGTKVTLELQIHDITGIPLAALRGKRLSNFSVDERMRWAKNRETKRTEDKAYCLLGIFNVFLAPIYGEGENAFIRLKDEIDKSLTRSSEQKNPAATSKLNSEQSSVPSVSISSLLELILAICVGLGALWFVLFPTFSTGDNNVHALSDMVIHASSEGYPIGHNWRDSLNVPSGIPVIQYLEAADTWSFIRIDGVAYGGVNFWVHDDAHPQDISGLIETLWNTNVHRICVRIPDGLLFSSGEDLWKYHTIGQFRREVGKKWDGCRFRVNGLGFC